MMKISDVYCTEKANGLYEPKFLVILPEFQVTHLSRLVIVTNQNSGLLVPNYLEINLTSRTCLLQSAFNSYFTFKVMV